MQRWANEGMPVTRIGRYVAASPAQLERWLTREAGTKETVHIPADNADLTADLKRGLSEVRKTHRKGRPSQLILHEPGNRHNERGTSFSTSLINSDGRLRKA